MIINIDMMLNVLSNLITIIMFYFWVGQQLSRNNTDTIILLDNRTNTLLNSEKINQIKSIQS
ncbi:MAG TPA: hypothetical protein DHV28_03955 [Ignavibacteriales bacterium]|nr:hypothetical protein [Ignavibacteriales bacterium]